MKIFLIADQTETFVGMRLAGVDGVIVHSDEEFYSEFNKAYTNGEIGIILVMDRLYEKYGDFLVDKKLHGSLPLIVSIPQKGQAAAITSAVSSYIEAAIGAKL